jgi:hypothetical protein
MGKVMAMNDIRLTHVEIKPDRRGKIIAASLVLLAVLAGVAQLYREGWWKPASQPVVALDQLPQPTPPL